MGTVGRYRGGIHAVSCVVGIIGYGENGTKENFGTNVTPRGVRKDGESRKKVNLA